MKKIIMIASICFTTSVFASATTSAHLDQDWPRVPKNKTFTWSSTHSYAMTNESDVNQSISMCFDIILCPEYTEHLKTTRDCRSFNLAPHQSVSDKKTINVTASFPSFGRCHIIAQTETTGGSYSKSTDVKEFEITFS